MTLFQELETYANQDQDSQEDMSMQRLHRNHPKRIGLRVVLAIAFAVAIVVVIVGVKWYLMYRAGKAIRQGKTQEAQDIFAALNKYRGTILVLSGIVYAAELLVEYSAEPKETRQFTVYDWVQLIVAVALIGFGSYLCTSRSPFLSLIALSS